ncbi:MAG: DNA helicase PcrA [Ancrocorticia sp.]|uniref:DNA helicase PcrA n=2 Tax=Ancrocorticia sp. TaxID=2593684 RepID=UPI003F8EE9FF
MVSSISASREAYLSSMARLRARINEASAQQADSAAAPSPDLAGADVSSGRAGAGGMRGVGARNAQAEKILEGLNPQQRKAVTHTGGPLLVVAGAGSGKTRVLTARIAYLIASGQARPNEVLAITFTNKAAKEMRERLEQNLGGLARHMWISTFHSACVRILRKEHATLGMRSTFTIYDQTDAQRLMNMVCREGNFDYRAFPPKTLSRQVSDLKNEMVTPQEAARRAEDRATTVLAEAYAAYQQRLHAANAMDFDDLIMQAVLLLENHPDLAEHYRRRFRHILVDEYQDTNTAQYQLVKVLAGGVPEAEEGGEPGEGGAVPQADLMVVGDADQSIYAFRGATIRNIEDFEHDFPNATSILLEQNYRSTQSILSAANAVIANNQGRRPKKLWTDQGGGEKLVGYVADSEADESSFVVEEIDRLRDTAGYRYGDIAVFYRTNAQSRAVEDMFVRSGIPYKVIGGTRFYERREIKDAMAYLHAVVNPDDTVSLRRVLNMPKRGLGQKAEEHVALQASRYGISFGAALADVAHPENSDRAEVAGLTARARKSLEAFVRVLEKGREVAESGAGPAEVLDEVLDEAGYLAMLRESTDPQDESRLENLAELHSVASEFRTINPEGTLEEWLDQVSLVADSDQLPEADGGEGEVTLMTIHTAKGLEFPVVFVTGMEDGTFPHMRSLADPKELAEERRIAYVALTRARQRLYLTRAATRSAWGAPQEFPASRFLEEIPDDVMEWRREQSSQDVVRASYQGNGFGQGRFGQRGRGSFDDDGGPVFGSGKPFVPGKLGADSEMAQGGEPEAGSSGQEPSGGKADAETGGLSVGDAVRHKSFGTGKIVAFEGSGKSTVAKVNFRGGVTKRLMLRFAPLEKA